jgi:hypothetical protein
MIRLIAVAGFALSVAMSAQAMTPAPIPEPDGMITQIAAACGAGRPELTVCAWPEPPCARPAEPSAGVRSERLASADVFKLPALGVVAHLSSFPCRDFRESH